MLRIATQLNNLYVTYDHADWEYVLSGTSGKTPESEVYQKTKRRLPWFEIRAVTELYEGGLFIKLPDSQEASCGLSHVKLSLDRIAGKMLFTIRDLFFSLMGNLHTIIHASYQFFDIR